MLVLVAIGVAFYAGLILDSFVAIRLLGTTREILPPPN